MHRIRSLILLLISTVIFSACAAGNQTKTVETKADKDGYDAEETILTYAPFQIEELPGLEHTPPYFFVTPKKLAAEPYISKREIVSLNDSDPEPQIVHGYRVQLFSGRDRGLAGSIEKKLAEELDEKVYIHFEAPLYKIRAGDFFDRGAALEFCNQLRNLGYRDAWVVRCLVVAHR